MNKTLKKYIGGDFRLPKPTTQEKDGDKLGDKKPYAGNCPICGLWQAEDDIVCGRCGNILPDALDKSEIVGCGASQIKTGRPFYR